MTPTSQDSGRCGGRATPTGPTTLFDGYEPLAVEPEPKLSADRRRTLRQRADVAAGRHPLTRQRHVGLDSDRKCGNCAFRTLFGYHNRSYPKCTRHEQYFTHSASTDVRAWWPGCTDHEWGDPKLSPDAARHVPEGAA